MSECKDCAKATFAGFCEAKMAWTALDAPKCGFFEQDPREAKLWELEDALRELFECLEGHCTANLPPTDYTLDLWRAKLAKHGIEVKRA